VPLASRARLARTTLFGAVAALACRSRAIPDGAPEASSAPEVASAADPRGACRALIGGAPRPLRLRVAGEERLVHLVPPARGHGPFPVIFGFHGRGGNGAHAARTFALERAVRTPFLGLYPDGRPQPWMRGAIGWDTRDEASPDLTLFDALLEWARDQGCGDLTRVAVVGYSWGGGMANHVACTRPARIRAVVSVGGGGPSVPCVGSVSALVVHGAEDREEPIASGRDTLEAWAFAARCDTGERPALGGRCVAREGCAQGRRILWCEHAGGHLWPEWLRGPTLGEFLGW